MGPKAWKRGWTTMPRECGARTSSRASRRPWPSTRPAAGARSSCQMRAKCTVSAKCVGQAEVGVAPPACPAPCSLSPARPVGWGSPGRLPGGRVRAGLSCVCLGPPPAAPRKQAGRSPHAPRLSPALLAGGFGVTQGARKTGSVQRAFESL